MEFIKRNAFILIIITGFICITFGIIFSLTILPLISSFSLVVQKIPNEYDPVSMLSINIGLLQGLIAIITIIIAIGGIFNYTTIKKEIDNLKNEVNKHTEQLININKNTAKNNKNSENNKEMQLKEENKLIPMEDTNENIN
ncbi:hypothetical protein EPJ67_01580 [Brachyspira aalborgi]|uniref:Uncharacterized protein n=1 Tax=Brachyspira aalborgi TaxID=29522 RepID=A0A5C8G964_9SPIR|nr:hypothetical protein [Brachyspira aalborgi]TXJ58426.1 hypothetical protein EPJ67_01580 [Brachyspira aalborgi]